MTEVEQTPKGPWRILILDRDPADPKWIVATVTGFESVRPAGPGAELDDVTVRWSASVAGFPHASLIHLRRAQVWRIEEIR
jgi:hypothetical protein